MKLGMIGKGNIMVTDAIKIRQAEAIAEQNEEARRKSILEAEEYLENQEIEERYATRNRILEQKNSYNKFIRSIKETLLNESINTLFVKSLPIDIANGYDNTAYSVNFIKENGCLTLLESFKRKNTFLSEMSMVIDKYYNIIVEKTDKNDKETHKISDEDKDSFLDELENKDYEQMGEMIRDRVKDSVDQFIENNSKDKELTKELIDDSKEKADKATNESVSEYYKRKCKRDVRDIKNKRTMSVFENMVSLIGTGVTKNESLRESFIVDGKVDVEKIIENGVVMYTFLEMCNTTSMIKIDGEYIEKVFKSLEASE